MGEPLDTELLKDLKGLGKPPSFDGNDSEYQDFRFSFRIHMSLVSRVSHTLMDKCEVERNPISLTAMKALGDAHLKCCAQMFRAAMGVSVIFVSRDGCVTTDQGTRVTKNDAQSHREHGTAGP